MPGDDFKMVPAKGMHRSHPAHELELKKYQKRYTCDGCKEDGFGSRYRCEICDFDLHEHCMFRTTTSTINLEFFKGYTFKFFDQPPGVDTRYCDACGKKIKGFVYHCEDRGWDLHPGCYNLENKISIDGVKFRLLDKVSKKCIWCKKRTLRNSACNIPGWSYVSKCENYHFHVHCITEMMLESWKNRAEDIESLTSENIDAPLRIISKGNRKKGSKFWKVVKIFLATVASILLGDPTMAVASVFVSLISN